MGFWQQTAVAASAIRSLCAHLKAGGNISALLIKQQEQYAHLVIACNKQQCVGSAAHDQYSIHLLQMAIIAISISASFLKPAGFNYCSKWQVVFNKQHGQFQLWFPSNKHAMQQAGCNWQIGYFQQAVHLWVLLSAICVHVTCDTV